MQKFLVVSYDDDQQQWFWDYVVSSNAENAAAKVCKDRPYVIAADAVLCSELMALTDKLARMNVPEVNASYKRATKEA